MQYRRTVTHIIVVHLQTRFSFEKMINVSAISYEKNQACSISDNFCRTIKSSKLYNFQLYRRFRERMIEETGLQMFPENRYRRRRRDVQRQSVPQSGSSDRKSSIADGWKTGAWDNKRWCRCIAKMLTSLVSRRRIEFLSMVRLSCLV